MNQANYNSNHDVFAEQYVEEYAKLRAQYPWWTIKQVMVKAKECTIEYLYQQLKSDLKAKPVWPRGFVIEGEKI